MFIEKIIKFEYGVFRACKEAVFVIVDFVISDEVVVVQVPASLELELRVESVFCDHWPPLLLKFLFTDLVVEKFVLFKIVDGKAHMLE